MDWTAIVEPVIHGVKWVLIISAIGWWLQHIVRNVIDFLLKEMGKP